MKSLGLALLLGGFVRVPGRRYAEEGWLAMVLIVSSIWSIDHYGNVEAWIWAVTCARAASKAK